MIEFFKTIIFEPLYNLLIFLTNVVPGADVGIAIILLTLIVKFLLFPLSRKTIVSQAKMKKLQPQLDKIKEDFPDKQEQAKKTFALYKEHKISPLSGCLPVLLQLPIILSLFYVFRDLSVENLDILYSFITVPENISPTLFWLMDLTEKSFLIAGLAGVSQWLVSRYSPSQNQKVKEGDKSMQATLQKGLQAQMKYVFPVLIAIFSYQLFPPIAIYWITNNLFTIGQEIFIKKKLDKMEEVVVAEVIE
jgi:YidC/Oxa1 family membrane protein insertase